MVMPKKYFIERKHDDGHVDYKTYKCIEGWCSNKNACWKFSRQGALGIIKSYRERNPSYTNGHYSLSIVEASEDEGRCVDQRYAKRLERIFNELNL